MDLVCCVFEKEGVRFLWFSPCFCEMWTLLQVVQDFVQATADEETPTEWLHRIMETNSREEGDYDINLLGQSYSHKIPIFNIKILLYYTLI